MKDGDEEALRKLLNGEAKPKLILPKTFSILKDLQVVLLDSFHKRFRISDIYFRNNAESLKLYGVRNRLFLHHVDFQTDHLPFPNDALRAIAYNETIWPPSIIHVYYFSNFIKGTQHAA